MSRNICHHFPHDSPTCVCWDFLRLPSGKTFPHIEQENAISSRCLSSCFFRFPWQIRHRLLTHWTCLADWHRLLTHRTFLCVEYLCFFRLPSRYVSSFYSCQTILLHSEYVTLTRHSNRNLFSAEILNLDVDCWYI